MAIANGVYECDATTSGVVAHFIASTGSGYKEVSAPVSAKGGTLERDMLGRATTFKVLLGKS